MNEMNDVVYANQHVAGAFYGDYFYWDLDDTT